MLGSFVQRYGGTGGTRVDFQMELSDGTCLGPLTLKFVRATMQSSPTTSVTQQIADLKVSYVYLRAQTSTEFKQRYPKPVPKSTRSNGSKCHNLNASSLLFPRVSLATYTSLDLQFRKKNFFNYHSSHSNAITVDIGVRNMIP